MILNKDIHEFDDLEIQVKTQKHSIKDYIKRILFVIDAKLFEKTYKDEFEKQNKELDLLESRVIVLQRDVKKLMRKIKRLEKRLSKYE